MPQCPQCQTKVQATDTHCMQCGKSLIEPKLPSPPPLRREPPPQPPPVEPQPEPRPHAEAIGRAEAAIHEAQRSEVIMDDTGRGIMAFCFIMALLDLIGAYACTQMQAGTPLVFAMFGAAVSTIAVGAFASRLLHSASTILGAQASQIELLALLLREHR